MQAQLGGAERDFPSPTPADGWQERQWAKKKKNPEISGCSSTIGPT